MADDAKEPEEAPEERECRICRGEGEENNPLYVPCDCRGSIRYCHEECLVRCDRGVPLFRDDFTPSTRLVSRNDGRGWFFSGF